MIDVVLALNTVNMTERTLAPYDTGNLANNGIGNIESDNITAVNYKINERGTAPYGIILNDALVIRSGRNVSYENIHFMWHDRAFEIGLYQMAAQLGGELFGE